MAIKRYAGLDTNYLPTDGSVPVALGDEAIELTVTSGSISQAVSLQGYDKIAFVTEGGTNTSIDFLELIGSETTDATLEIVKDISASSGYALKLTGTQKLVFGTRISYVPNILKKITLKAKKDAGNTGNLYASVMSYANGQYINKSGNISIEDYVSVVDTSSLTTSYTTNIGYIKDTGTNYIEPASNPNSPSELPATTDEIALVLESTGASDIWYIDVISLEEVENSIRDIPDGQGVYDSSQNFNTRNDRITTTPANPVVTTPSTYTLNGDGSIDITFTWAYTGTGDAYNIDGFGIYTYSSDNSTPPTFTDSAVYVDATTRNFTLYGITINKYYTIGVQAYRQVDHDIAVNLALSEDVIRSSIVQSTPYRPVNITPSTTSYAIQRNVGSYLGSESLGSIYIHGYYPNGMRGDIAGQILYNEGSSATDMYLAINAQAVDCTDFTYTANKEYKCYLVLNAGVVKPAIYDINTNTFVNDTETVSTGVVIGYVIVDYTHSGTVYTIKDAYVYESAKLLSMSKTTKLEEAWQYLSEATNQSDWESRVDDLGIENSFTFLAAYNAFIVNLKAVNVTAGYGNGSTGGFRFRAMSDRDMDGGNIPVFDVMYNNRKVFEVNPESGNIMLGNYNPNTKSGGILYDYVNDKLLGNVAYDQWDLVIESDADLALLTTGTTIYENVLITPGEWNASAMINLEAHSVKNFIGCGREVSKINANFTIPHNSSVINVGDTGVDGTIANFSIHVTASQSYDHKIIYLQTRLTYIGIRDIDIYGNDSYSVGVSAGSSISDMSMDRIRLFLCKRGFSNLSNISNCILNGNLVSNSIGMDNCTRCTNIDIKYFSVACRSVDSGANIITIVSTSRGFEYCHNMVNCHSKPSGFGTYGANSGGFYYCERLTNCTAQYGTINYSNCNYISSCYSYNAGSIGFQNCSHISSSLDSGSQTSSSGCSKVDTDSCTL